ncbi:hypothetical protein GCM10010360_55830 [Streptomyces nogalater]
MGGFEGRRGAFGPFGPGFGPGGPGFGPVPGGRVGGAVRGGGRGAVMCAPRSWPCSRGGPWLTVINDARKKLYLILADEH